MGVLKQVQDIENRLPFPLKGFDSDNGNEFLNWHLFNYFASPNARRPSIAFTRSSPYHKDDNAHVKQKNWSHVRQLLGYYRFDNPNIVPPLNDLYRNELSLFNNFFLPNLKLQDKVREGSRVHKKYGPVMTPYQRLIGHGSVSDEGKERLEALHGTLDPFELKRQIKLKLKRIFGLVVLKNKPRGAVS